MIFPETTVASSIYYGLSALQHRGQESCGIAVSDTKGPKGNIDSHKGMGLVSEVFKEENLHSLHGNLGIGHVRYSTTGATTLANASLCAELCKGNSGSGPQRKPGKRQELRDHLEKNGALFHTTTDSEVIAYCIARERITSKTVEEAILKTAGMIRGAYGLSSPAPESSSESGSPWSETFVSWKERQRLYPGF